MSSPDERSAHIVEIVRNAGYASNDDLARILGVTVQTVRRDVNRLAEQGRLARHHGGAGLPSSIENIAYSERQVLNRSEKQAIARLAAARIPHHSSLFINLGTTTEAFAQALHGHDGLQVITNNLQVAAGLWSRPGFKVVVAGGMVRAQDGGVIGQSACEQIAQYRADFGVIGISGIDEDGALLDFDVEEIRVARAIMRNARQVLLLADHTKFGRRPMMRMGALDEVDALFTDRPPPGPISSLLAERGIACHVAEWDGDDFRKGTS